MNKITCTYTKRHNAISLSAKASTFVEDVLFSNVFDKEDEMK